MEFDPKICQKLWRLKESYHSLEFFYGYCIQRSIGTAIIQGTLLLLCFCWSIKVVGDVLKIKISNSSQKVSLVFMSTITCKKWKRDQTESTAIPLTSILMGSFESHWIIDGVINFDNIPCIVIYILPNILSRLFIIAFPINDYQFNISLNWPDMAFLKADGEQLWVVPSNFHKHKGSIECQYENLFHQIYW